MIRRAPEVRDVPEGVYVLHGLQVPAGGAPGGNVVHMFVTWSQNVPNSGPTKGPQTGCVIPPKGAKGSKATPVHVALTRKRNLSITKEYSRLHGERLADRLRVTRYQFLGPDTLEARAVQCGLLPRFKVVSGGFQSWSTSARLQPHKAALTACLAVAEAGVQNGARVSASWETVRIWRGDAPGLHQPLYTGPGSYSLALSRMVAEAKLLVDAFMDADGGAVVGDVTARVVGMQAIAAHGAYPPDTYGDCAHASWAVVPITIPGFTDVAM